MSNQVSVIYNELDKNFQGNPNLRIKLHSELSRLISATYSQSMDSDEGYCYKFTLPTTAVMNLFPLLQLNPEIVRKAFQNDWKFPNNATMYNDSYYHILLLIVYYGIKHKDVQLINNALFLLLQKIWNGRKYRYIKYCDKKVMNYVISHLLNKKHNMSKFDSPLLLIKDYYVPTLINKYGSEILNNILRLKQLFIQSWVRIDQLYTYNSILDPDSGKKKAQGGLLPLYMKAKQNNLYLTTPTVMKNDDGQVEFDQYATVHGRDKIITSTSDFISMNVKEQYPVELISNINKNTKVSVKVIEVLLSSIHDHKFYDLIHDAFTIILSRTNVVDKNDICKKDFMLNVKRNIISSKNNDSVNKLQNILNKLCSDIFSEKLGIDFNKYGRTQQIQITTIILYGLIFNLKRLNCSRGVVDI